MVDRIPGKSRISSGFNDLRQFVTRKLNKTEEKVVHVRDQALRLKKLAKGKDKVVMISSDQLDTENVVYYTPAIPRFVPRKNPVKKEFQTMEGIKKALGDVEGASDHLLIDGEFVDKGGRFFLKVERGQHDLDEGVKKERSLDQRLGYGKNLLKGLSLLHQANYLHGDLKLDNVMVFGEPPDEKVKICDFGKSRKQEKDSHRYVGNLRFAPPEGVLSQKGEVYSAALMLIRILEENVLGDEGNPLKYVENKNLDPVPVRGGLRGIERFIAQHKSYPGIKCKSFKQRLFEQLPRQLKVANQTIQNKAAQVGGVHGYINTLTNKLDLNEDQKTALNKLLKEMTHLDPEKRPTMEEALKRFEKILPS